MADGCFSTVKHAAVILGWILALSEGGVVPTETTELPPTGSWTVITLWPDAVIPYDMPDGMYDSEKAGIIQSAMKRWEYKTCLKFVPWTADLGSSYVKFFSAGSCFSKLGKEKFQPQLLGIGTGCVNMYTVIHELGHTIGLVHEMERADRDMYIDVIYDNINPASVGNFDTTEMKNMTYKLYRTPYDYKSIMHYGPKYWSSNSEPTMVTRDPAYYHVIGKVDDVSFFDALYVNRAYECAAKCPVSQLSVCRNGGFLGGPDCRCICQDGYAGQFCEQTVPGYHHIVEWSCQEGWRFYEGWCYLALSDTRLNAYDANSVCAANNATLAVFKDRPDMEWMNHLITEQQLIKGVERYWVGVIREATQTQIQWQDGTSVDTNIVSVVGDVGTNERGCGVFNGETVALEKCSNTGVGYVCQKQFDSTCGGRYIVTTTPSTIQSPNFPGDYPWDLTCTYILQTNEGSRIQIDFDPDSVFESSTNCRNDRLQINLSDDVTQDGVRYCGNDLKGATLTSDGNLAVLTFRSNSQQQLAGFKAVLTEIKPATATTTTETFLGALDDALGVTGTPEETLAKQQITWSLSAIYNLIKAMPFFKIL